MRDSKPWYRKSTDAWYAQVNRRQIRLVKGRDNRQEAKRKLAELLVAVQPVKTDALTVAQVCDKFLAFSQIEHKPDTYDWYHFYLQKFCDRHGVNADRKGRSRAGRNGRCIDGHFRVGSGPGPTHLNNWNFGVFASQKLILY